MGTSGSRSVIVCDALPVRRCALVAALEQAGFLTLEFGEIDLTSDAPDAVIVWSCDDHAVPAAISALDTPSSRVIAVLSDPSANDYADALCSGVIGVFSQDSPPTEIAAVITEALEGRTLLPAGVARDMAQAAAPEKGPLSLDELDWIRMLAAGASITEVADRARLSERDMYRALRRAYDRLGARNRIEAVMAATRSGLL